MKYREHILYILIIILIGVYGELNRREAYKSGVNYGLYQCLRKIMTVYAPAITTEYKDLPSIPDTTDYGVMP